MAAIFLRFLLAFSAGWLLESITDIFRISILVLSVNLYHAFLDGAQGVFAYLANSAGWLLTICWNTTVHFSTILLHKTSGTQNPSLATRACETLWIISVLLAYSAGWLLELVPDNFQPCHWVLSVNLNQDLFDCPQGDFPHLANSAGWLLTFCWNTPVHSCTLLLRETSCTLGIDLAARAQDTFRTLSAFLAFSAGWLLDLPHLWKVQFRTLFSYLCSAIERVLANSAGWLLNTFLHLISIYIARPRASTAILAHTARWLLILISWLGQVIYWPRRASDSTVTILTVCFTLAFSAGWLLILFWQLQWHNWYNSIQSSIAINWTPALRQGSTLADSAGWLLNLIYLIFSTSLESLAAILTLIFRSFDITQSWHCTLEGPLLNFPPVLRHYWTALIECFHFSWIAQTLVTKQFLILIYFIQAACAIAFSTVAPIASDPNSRGRSVRRDTQALGTYSDALPGPNSGHTWQRKFSDWYN